MIPHRYTDYSGLYDDGYDDFVAGKSRKGKTMRPTKFRAWDKVNNKWLKEADKELIINLSADDVGYFEICEYNAVYRNPCGLGTTIELLQSTGLCDENDQEIYEGDILRYPPKDEWEKTNYVAFEVFFHNGDCACVHIGFQMNRMHFHGAISGWGLTQGFIPKHVKNMKVIGNIHSNPELIEEKKE